MVGGTLPLDPSLTARGDAFLLKGEARTYSSPAAIPAAASRQNDGSIGKWKRGCRGLLVEPDPR